MAEREPLMTTVEVAEYLGMHRQTVGRLAARGVLPGFKIGREWRFKRVDIEKYLDGLKEQQGVPE